MQMPRFGFSFRITPRRISVEQIWKIGRERAYSPDRLTQAMHSGFVRRNTKPAAVMQGAANAAGALIPIPMVGGAITALVETAIARTRAENNRYKIQKYGYGNNAKLVKHEIKSLDVETLDRSRAKVKSAVEDLNQLHLDQPYQQENNICNHRVNLAQKYFYLEKRIDLLEERAAAFEAIGKRAKEWAKEQRVQLNRSHDIWERDVKKPKPASDHANCTNVCVNPQA